MTPPESASGGVCGRCGTSEHIHLRRWVGDEWVALALCPACDADHPLVRAVLDAASDLLAE